MKADECVRDVVGVTKVENQWQTTHKKGREAYQGAVSGASMTVINRCRKYNMRALNLLHRHFCTLTISPAQAAM